VPAAGEGGEQVSRQLIIRCDVCGAPEAESLSLPVNKAVSAAGSTEVETFQMDICRIHLLCGLTFALEGAPGATVLERNQALFNYYRKIEWKEKLGAQKYQHAKG
jgi:hypothetical protein